MTAMAVIVMQKEKAPLLRGFYNQGGVARANSEKSCKEISNHILNLPGRFCDNRK